MISIRRWEGHRHGLAGGDDSELFIEAVASSVLEVEPDRTGGDGASGASTLARSRRARDGVLYGWTSRIDSLEDLPSDPPLKALGPGALPPLGPEVSAPLDNSLEPESLDRLHDAARRCLPKLPEASARYQTVLVRDEVREWALYRAAALRGFDRIRNTQLWIRIETPWGAVVFAENAQGPEGLEGDKLKARVEEVLALVSAPPGVDLEPLPVVFRPPVAAPLIWALGTLLRGDVAAGAGLARAVGKQLFPSVLTITDEVPEHFGPVDEEGVPRASVRAISAGKLTAFLHTAQSAQALGVASNGRAVRSGTTAAVIPAALGLSVAPGNGALPDDCIELTTRFETFSMMPRAGALALIAGGFVRRGGRRVRTVGPVALDLPVLQTLRRCTGALGDVDVLAALDGVRTPTLVFDDALPLRSELQ